MTFMCHVIRCSNKRFMDLDGDQPLFIYLFIYLFILFNLRCRRKHSTIMFKIVASLDYRRLKDVPVSVLRNRVWQSSHDTKS